jgi:hypothetical protein
MRGRLLDFSITRDGRQRLFLELDADFSEGFDKLHGADVNIAIKKWKPVRSLDANAFFHALVNQIAECLGESAEAIKADLAVDYGVVGTYAKLPAEADIDLFYPYNKLIKETEENGRRYKVYALYKRTHDLTTEEFSRLLDGTISEAKLLGIDTDTPAQKAILKGD